MTAQRSGDKPRLGLKAVVSSWTLWVLICGAKTILTETKTSLCIVGLQSLPKSNHLKKALSPPPQPPEN